MPLNVNSNSLSPAETRWRILPQGDRCLIVSFGERIDAAIGRTCLAAARKLRDARLPGVTDVVPSFVAVAVHYRPGGHGEGPTYAALSEHIQALLAEGIPTADAGDARSTSPSAMAANTAPTWKRSRARPASNPKTSSGCTANRAAWCSCWGLRPATPISACTTKN